MTVPNQLFLDRLNKYQLEYLSAFDRGEARFGILEWHRRSFKSTTAINLLVRECVENPLSRYVYVAPTQVMAREIVWDDPHMLNDALPDRAEIDYVKNETKMTVKFANGSLLKIAGADKPDTLRGIDAVGVAFDEWPLIKHTTWTEIFRPIIAQNPKRWALFLYTPKGLNHATQMFNTAACIEDEAELPRNGKAKKCRLGWFASRLIADETGIIPTEELEEMQVEIADGLLLQEIYDQEMQCRRVTDEERTLITSAMLERLKTVNWDSLRRTLTEKRRIVAIDPAFGGDQCVIKGIENTRVIETKVVHFTLTSEVVFEAKLVAQEIGTKNFIVDCIGNGKGVADGLAVDAMNYNVQYFNSAGKVDDSDMFENKKAEAVYYVSAQIARCKVEPIEDFETKRQLTFLSKYRTTHRGLMIMMHNDDVKKNLGCSPDKGLCYVYGIYGLQYVPVDVVSDWEKRHHRVKSPMLM